MILWGWSGIGLIILLPPHFFKVKISKQLKLNTIMNNEQFSDDAMWKTIEHYETYFNGKRSQRQKYIMGRAIKRFVTFNHLENPNMYLLYLIADKSLNRIKSKSENGRVSELEKELQKDIHLFIK